MPKRIPPALLVCRAFGGNFGKLTSSPGPPKETKDGRKRCTNSADREWGTPAYNDL